MTLKDPKFTIGIEEEYLLIDAKTGNLVAEPPDTLLTECEAKLGGQVSPEFLRSQIEVDTKVCETVAEARQDLANLRRCIADIARAHDLKRSSPRRPIPSPPGTSKSTRRRNATTHLPEDLQGVVRRLMISGMHVHVGIEDDEMRIDLMNQVAYFLPHLLVLSTSSPFWQGRNTGLKSYRLSVWDEVPRTGLPEQFDSFGEYRRHVAMLVQTGIIEDATKLWWDIRPSDRYPDAGGAHLRPVPHDRGHGLPRRHLSLFAAHVVAASAQQSALAQIRQPADRREPVAGATLRLRRRANRLRDRQDRPVRRTCWTKSSSW